MNQMDFSLAQAKCFLQIRICNADGEAMGIENVMAASFDFPSIMSPQEAFADSLNSIDFVSDVNLNEQNALEIIKKCCTQDEINDFIADCLTLITILSQGVENEVERIMMDMFEKFGDFLEADADDVGARARAKLNL